MWEDCGLFLNAYRSSYQVLRLCATHTHNYVHTVNGTSQDHSTATDRSRQCNKYFQTPSLVLLFFPIHMQCTAFKFIQVRPARHPQACLAATKQADSVTSLTTAQQQIKSVQQQKCSNKQYLFTTHQHFLKREKHADSVRINSLAWPDASGTTNHNIYPSDNSITKPSSSPSSPPSPCPEDDAPASLPATFTGAQGVFGEGTGVTEIPLRSSRCCLQMPMASTPCCASLCLKLRS